MTIQLDPRRYVAFRAIGGARLLLSVHADLEDVDGAVEAGQFGVAAVQARQAIIGSLAVRSLATAGEPDAAADQLTFDPFAGLAEEEVDQGLELAARGLEIEAGDDARQWAFDIRAHVSETERRLGYRQPLESIRTPAGMFPALRMARQWMPAIQALGLPTIFPEQWTGSTS